MEVAIETRSSDFSKYVGAEILAAKVVLFSPHNI